MANIEQTHPWTGCDRLIVFQNDHSSHFSQVNAEMSSFQATGFEALKRLGIAEIERVPTSPDTAENITALQQLDQHDAIAIIGGDGTVSAMLAAAESIDHRRPIALLGGGNANDIAAMANGRALGNIEKNLTRGRARQLKPLEIHASGGLELTARAYGYLSIGYTAHVAAYLNRPDFRAKTHAMSPLPRVAYEARVCIGEMGTSPQFDVYDNNGLREAGELVFMNGRRMAKNMRSRESIFNERATYAEVADSRFRSLLGGLTRLAIGASPKLNAGQIYGGIISPKNLPVPLQIDGEVSETTMITAPTRIRIRTISDSITLLAQ
jgi:hypothetical protein